jgi:hypothetical protein
MIGFLPRFHPGPGSLHQRVVIMFVLRTRDSSLISQTARAPSQHHIIGSADSGTTLPHPSGEGTTRA